MGRSLIIFDMDGVLIDVSGSYREVTRRTVIEYLRNVIGAKSLPEDFLTLNDVDRIKKSGGLNNDWDLSYEILNSVLTTCVDPHNAQTAHAFGAQPSNTRDEQLLDFARKAQKKIDTTALLSQTGSKPFSEHYFGSFSSETRTSPFLLRAGDVKSGNIVKRIFQELYLGRALFEEIYEEPPLICKGEGYIAREGLIASPENLDTLSGRHTLSIATGRPAVEAHHAIDRFGLSSFFAAVVTEDDVVRAEATEKRPLRKPDPFSLLRCMEKSGFSRSDTVSYVGDMPDDMIAAKNAGVTPVGFVHAWKGISEESLMGHSSLLVREGAYRVFRHFDELVEYFLQEQQE
jgi:HAD superfamily hydrolase (TIGR01548 family)